MKYNINGHVISIRPDRIFEGTWLLFIKKKCIRFKEYDDLVNKVANAYNINPTALEDYRIESLEEHYSNLSSQRENKENAENGDNGIQALELSEAVSNLEAYFAATGPKTCLCGCGSHVGAKSLYAMGHDRRVVGMLVDYKLGKHVEFNPVIFKLIVRCKVCGNLMVINRHRENECHKCKH